MTKQTSHSLRAIRERAALYVAASLPDADRASFEDHLRTGCIACAAEVAAFSQVVPVIAEAVALSPPPDLRAKVLARVTAERMLSESPVLEHEGQRFVRSEGLAWAATDSRGVDVKTMLVDRERQRVTRLVRMAMGATIRRHRHAGVEELYVLEGGMIVEGVWMRAGDYCRAEPGSVHHEVRSTTGCVFLATSSLTDEFLPEGDVS